MPHSVSPDSSPSQDVELPDAPNHGDHHTAADQNGDHHTADDNGDQPMEEDHTSQDTAMPDTDGKTADIKLAELFADDSSDDEFSSSAPSHTLSSSPGKQSHHTHPAKPASAPSTDPEMMLAFYRRLYPFRYLFQWLNHSLKPSNDFAHREFAFTLQNDAYLRYQSYPTADLLRKDIARLNPSRFEIGPVYSTNPRERKTLRRASTFRPISKELVFDIDLTDYDDVRTCCDKANICLKCWSFVTMAVKVVDAALRDDFAFEHILWVYSGRRGCHAWISDKRAREMSDSARRGLAGYLEVLKGGAGAGKRVNVKRPLHPHLQRSFDILKSHFPSAILVAQNPFLSSSGADKLLSLLPFPQLVAALGRKWESAPGRSSMLKWADIDAVAKTLPAGAVDPKALLQSKQDIILEYTYPRLDVEVSKKMNHLLKAPFVVHPGTGRVCVPIDVQTDLENFDPLAVPTVSKLLAEIDSWRSSASKKRVDKQEDDGSGDGNDRHADEADGGAVKEEDVDEQGRRIPDWDKTSLGPYVLYFRDHVARMIKSEQRALGLVGAGGVVSGVGGGKRVKVEDEAADVKMEF